MGTEGSVGRPFRNLGIALAIGILIVVGLTVIGVNGPGLFTLPQAIVGLGLASAVITAILTIVLFRMSTVLEELRQIRVEQQDIRRRLAAPKDHHIITLEGIGEQFATRLNSMGIITIPQLLDANPARVAHTVGSSAAVVEDWQAMGRMMQVKGISSKAAELLVKAKVRTVADLARADPHALAATLETMGAAVEAETVGRWTQAAARLINRGAVKITA